MPYDIFKSINSDADDNTNEEIDIESLRHRLLEEATAMAFTGTPAAILDAGEIKRAGSDELREIAKRMGIK